VIARALLPWFLCSAATFALAFVYWEAAVDGVRAVLDRAELLAPLFVWLDAIGAAALRAVLAPLIVVALAVPVILVFNMWLVSTLVTPCVVRLVEGRRFAGMERRAPTSRLPALLRTTGFVFTALVVTAATVPLWFVPPLVLVLPALVWAWLVARVFGHGVLDGHAAADEREEVLRRHRAPLAVMGLVAGGLVAAPSWLWVLGAATLILAPLTMLVSVWLYTLVFVFCALWFAHYLLAALQAHRAALPVVDAASSSGVRASGTLPASATADAEP
jgi:hypothetical protein